MRGAKPGPSAGPAASQGVQRWRYARGPYGSGLSEERSTIEPQEGLDGARAAYAAREWRAARDGFAAARSARELAIEDLRALSDAAWWAGDLETALDAAEEGYRRALQGEDPAGAAMTALEIGYTHLLRGDEVAGSGWLSRAQRLLADRDEGVEHGYLAYIGLEDAMTRDDADGIILAARRVQTFGTRYDDRNLLALGTMGEGRGLIRSGLVADGLALLDEAALALPDDLSPEWAGNLYCHLVAACHELGDIRRATEWTDALTEWCERLAPAAVFTGICRVHRAQLFQLRGAWNDAAREATRVCDELVGIHTASVAEGWYARGDLTRLNGDLGSARTAYDRARELGRDPQPGVALLRLAEGRPKDALASVQAGLAVTRERLARAHLLPAAVTIALAAGDATSASEACAELERAADDFGSSGLAAGARHARGAVDLAAGDPAAALPMLLEARRRWHDVRAPYDGAHARVLVARAYRALGDEESAIAELRAARETFDELGAVLDTGAVEQELGVAGLPDGLTEREAEVLRLVAEGRTNREVARTLVISEKTVARHLSNVFAKIDVTSRTEAAAYAFANGIATADRSPRRG